MEVKPDPDAPLVPLSGDEVVSVLHRRQASKRKKASTKKVAKGKSIEFELKCLKKNGHLRDVCVLDYRRPGTVSPSGGEKGWPLVAARRSIHHTQDLRKRRK